VPFTPAAALQSQQPNSMEYRQQTFSSRSGVSRPARANPMQSSLLAVLTFDCTHTSILFAASLAGFASTWELVVREGESEMPTLPNVSPV
jgi:hypothetical protein